MMAVIVFQFCAMVIATILHIRMFALQQRAAKASKSWQASAEAMYEKCSKLTMRCIDAERTAEEAIRAAAKWKALAERRAQMS